MSAIKKLKDVFNWLNEDAKHQYVFGELLEKSGEPDSLTVPMKRGERFTERAITLTGTIFGFAAAFMTGDPLFLMMCPISKFLSIPGVIGADAVVKAGVKVTGKLDKKFNGAELKKL